METLSDIVASMRRGTKLPGYWRSCDLNEILAYHADRIEAAWKREKAEIEADALAVGGLVEAERRRVVVSKTETTTVGNAAAMRDAVVKALTLINVCDWPPGVSLDGVAEVIREIDSVLDKPPRNCDVGTAEDQFKRYLAFCHSESHGCKHCPANRTRSHGTSNCDLVWAQMPYVEEGAGK